MKLPSKVVPYADSTLARMPAILKQVWKRPMTPPELYAAVKKEWPGIHEFIETLDCLYVLGKVDLKMGRIFYVD